MPSHDSRPTIRIWIVDDSQAFRKEIVAVLESEPDIQVTGSFGSFESLEAHVIREGAASMANVILMDIHMPGKDGIEATEWLTERFTEAHVVMLTRNQDSERTFHALCAGALGYVTKDLSIDELLRSVRDAAAGSLYLPPQMARRVRKHFTMGPVRSTVRLTAREQETLEWLCKGLSQKLIAVQLGISEDTVSNHIRGIYRKLRVKSATAAVARAYEEGLVGRR